MWFRMNGKPEDKIHALSLSMLLNRRCEWIETSYQPMDVCRGSYSFLSHPFKGSPLQQFNKISLDLTTRSILPILRPKMEIDDKEA